jgi:hypothetical protein
MNINKQTAMNFWIELGVLIENSDRFRSLNFDLTFWIIFLKYSLSRDWLRVKNSFIIKMKK